MASFGKLYAYQGNPRTTSLLAVAKANNIKLDLVHTEPAKGLSADYLKLNKLGRIPTFEGNDGYILTEVIAIAIYLTSQNEKTTLLGKTKQDYASILRWMSFTNAEWLPSLAGWFRPLIGRDPYNKKTVDDHIRISENKAKVLEDHLMLNTYLVGERLTLADIFGASIASRPFGLVFDKEWRDAHPSITRWYETVCNQPIYSDIAGKLELIDKAIPNPPPKQEQQKKDQKEKPKKEQQQPKAAAAATAKDDDEEEEDKPAPKPKHPLEALPKPTMVLDDWKRKYSNEETREVALPWFWQNVSFSDYSLWAVDYNYNDELTMTFMTSNLIGGFFARLEASRKYIFGACSVYGVTNDSVIKGAFLVRGQEASPAFDVAPDYESYEFRKLDPSKQSDRAFVESMWAQDEAVTVEGGAKEWADGKVFK